MGNNANIRAGQVDTMGSTPVAIISGKPGKRLAKLDKLVITLDRTDSTSLRVAKRTDSQLKKTYLITIDMDTDVDIVIDGEKLE